MFTNYKNMSLTEFKQKLQEEIYGKDSPENKSWGLCIKCEQLALPNCYSEAGRREFKISGLCEKCFDEICNE